MKLSKHTLKILNNLAGFNQNFYASPGNSLRSMTSVKSCVCVTEIEETIDAEISLFSLTDFLDVVNILDDPVLDIQDDFIDLSCNDRRLSYRFFQTDPTALQKVKTMPPFPDSDLDFFLSEKDLSLILKVGAPTKAMPDLPDVVLEDGRLSVTDAKNDNSNVFSIELFDETREMDYKIISKIRNFSLLLPGSYDVSVHHKKISRFSHTDFNYVVYMAQEPASHFLLNKDL